VASRLRTTSPALKPVGDRHALVVVDMLTFWLAGSVKAIDGVKAPTLKANHEGGFSAADYKSGSA